MVKVVVDLQATVEIEAGLHGRLDSPDDAVWSAATTELEDALKAQLKADVVQIFDVADGR